MAQRPRQSSGSTTASQSGGATRRRGSELEEAILQAAWDVLVEQGYEGFTYEAIAARAQTSRPVLYRRWTQREALLQATLRYGWPEPVALADTGRLRTDAIAMMKHFGQSNRVEIITQVGAQLMAYFRETKTGFSDLRKMMLSPERAGRVATIVKRAVERGELAAMPTSPRVLTLPVDLVRHELLMTMRRVPDQTIIDIVDDIWLPLLHRTAAAQD
ncbi:TetR/AcrR family transcriptional regulator [Saccharospirillum mangrovi]|uniref:TetR/AcrR family transcriptional regulator n=1 Tax=Saccharospirillum mangrovi TaxID=2161747 RepID=UPI000D3BEF51|nr:TetR/AcrR family transcriptional regulator [Saccharospirillum mangrovi]